MCMQHGDRLQQLRRRARGCTPLALLLAIAIGAPNARAQSRETDEAAIRRISLARSDVALVHELHGMRGMRGPNGEPMPAQEELGVRVLVKDGARWRTTAFNHTIVRPPEPAPRP